MAGISRRKLWALVAGFLAVMQAPMVRAAGDGTAAPATPPAEVKPVTILVFGDSMADGLWGGLARSLIRDPAAAANIKLLRRGKNGTGLARPDVYDWPARLPEILEQEPPDLAVVSFGLNDRQDNFHEGRRQYYFRSDAWKQAYEARIESILKTLNEKKVKTVWVGLPIMRDAKISKDAEYLNGLYADVVAKQGGTFFSLWELSVGENQEYSSHGRGTDGRMRPFRNDDGMHFTMGGYDVLARELWKTLTGSQMARVGD